MLVRGAVRVPEHNTLRGVLSSIHLRSGGIRDWSIDYSVGRVCSSVQNNT